MAEKHESQYESFREEAEGLEYKELLLIFSDALTNLITIANKLDNKVHSDDQSTKSLLREFDRITTELKELAKNTNNKLDKICDAIFSVKNTVSELEKAVCLTDKSSITNKDDLKVHILHLQEILVDKVDELLRIAFEGNKGLIKQILKQSNNAVKSYGEGMSKWQEIITLVLKISGIIVLSAMGIKIGADVVLKTLGL